MAAEFIGEEGTLKGVVLTLATGDMWIIGRDSDECDIVLDDPKASRKHLICRLTPEGIALDNLSITNPAKINDESVLTPTLLHDGDKVTIGGTHFRFYNEKPSKAPMTLHPKEEENLRDETIFREEDREQIAEVHFDLKEASRFIFKVVAGPNTGAELALEIGREYLIGTDTTVCDIVFHDLSISRKHARLRVGHDQHLYIEDLGSRNGVVIQRERVTGSQVLEPGVQVTIGTSAFLVIDKEAPLQTIVTPLLEEEHNQLSSAMEGEKQEKREELKTEPHPAPAPLKKRAPLKLGSLIVPLIIAGFIVLLGIGMISLFEVKEVNRPPENYVQEIQTAIAKFPGVQFTYNRACKKIFLLGHVSTGIEKSELLYNLNALPFIQGIDDNVVNDEAVWQEMNILLSKMPDFSGVSMHAPVPGKFVLTGYLKTLKQAAALTDYMNINFNYLDRLENHIIVEEEILEEAQSALLQAGLGGVSVEFTNGVLTFTGYIATTKADEFQSLVKKSEGFVGVRLVRNYVALLTPEQAVTDLNELFPGRYQVTGYSTHCNININVVINGRILMRGDSIDGMRVTSIQSHTIFLEKDGLKYKIEYNK